MEKNWRDRGACRSRASPPLPGPPEKGRGPGDGGHPSLPLLHHPVSSPEKEVTLWAKQLKMRQAKTWNPCRGACTWTNTKYSNKIQRNYKRPNTTAHTWGKVRPRHRETQNPAAISKVRGAKAGPMQDPSTQHHQVGDHLVPMPAPRTHPHPREEPPFLLLLPPGTPSPATLLWPLVSE